MPVPSTFSDLSTTPASNSPAGSDSPTVIDDHIRALYAFVASVYTNTGNGWASPWLTSENPSYTGTLTGGAGAVNLGSGQFYKDASGNVGIGTSAPGAKLEVAGSGNLVRLGDGTNTFNVRFQGPNNWDLQLATSTDVFSLRRNSTSLLDVDSGGSVLISATTLNTGVTGNCKLHVLGTGADYSGAFRNSHASNPFGLYVYYDTAINSAGSYFYAATDVGATRFLVKSNGGISNFQANDTNLSDERLKTDFKPAADYYSRWCEIDFVTYLYRDQTDLLPNLGVKAQQLQTVFPELVDADGYGMSAPDGTPYLGVYQTDFQYATAVALQQAIKEIEALRSRVAALERGSA